MVYIFRLSSKPIQKFTGKNVGKRFLSSKQSFSDDSYQYLERSTLPSMHFQKSLPRLPIPKLENTLTRYLSAVKVFLDDRDYEKAEKLTKEFGEGVGKKLHDEVVEKDKGNKNTSYISEPWFDMYLKSRTPIPINYNPFLAWVNDPNEKYNDQVIRASNLIISACRFKRSLDSGVLSPHVFHMDPSKSDTPNYRRILKFFPPSLSWYGSYLLFNAFPLDMSQYPSLFNSTRIPVMGKDQLRRYTEGRHLIVMRKGHFFKVEVLEKNGLVKSPQEIHASISHITSLQLEPPKHPLGVLTTLNRDDWASVRSQLIQEGNEESLGLIDSAVFVMCLDEVKSTEPEVVCKNMLHSDGINRWFDKSFSIIIHADGLSAINFEHSWGDGVAVMRILEEVNRDSIKNHWIGPDTKVENLDVSGNVKKLEHKIHDALSQYKSWCDKLQFGTVDYRKLNKELVKKMGLSPDAVMQAVVQLAFFRQYHKRVPTYESCSTAAFKLGRTETVRSATIETNRFVDAVLAKEEPGKVLELLKECSKKHSNLVKEAATGQGFDRHLFAMKYIAESRGSQIPQFYTDQTYQQSNHYILSTSTLSTEHVQIGGFGPVVPDGYGVGYNIGEDRLGFCVSAYKDTRNVKEFARCLEESLDDVYRIFEATKR